MARGGDSAALDAPPTPGSIPSGEGFEWFRAPEEPGSELVCSVVRPAADYLLQWIDQNAADRRIGVLGYSQGGAVALQMLRRAPGRIEFAVLLAGFTTTDGETGDAELARRRTPVFWGHGARDAVIPPGDIVRMRRFLPEHAAVEERVYDDADHWITTEMSADVQRFIRAQDQQSMPILTDKAIAAADVES